MRFPWRLVLFFLLVSWLFISEGSRQMNPSSLPMLLNTGMVEVEEATCRYIVWAEEPERLPQIEKVLLGFGLPWQKETLKDFSGQQAFQYTAIRTIGMEEEKEAFASWLHLRKGLSSYGVAVILEERIDSGMDLRRYFEELGIQGEGFVQSGNLLSRTGSYRRATAQKFLDQQMEKLQVVTRMEGIGESGKTVLAYPALLQEF